jgi:ribosomal protein S18 acetylase RimI-like enzyme
MSIRKAEKMDCALIHALAGKVFPHTYRDILTPEQIKYMMEWMYSIANLRKQMEEGHEFFIASWDGADCGYVSVTRDGKDLFHLQKIYVLPEFQGLHIGDALFRQAIEFVRSSHGEGACGMELNVNRHNPARGFYEKQGMKEVNRGDFPIGNGFYMNDYIMRLDIK